MIRPSEIGQGQVTHDKRSIGALPRPRRVPLLVGYTVILVLVGSLIVYSPTFGIIWTMMMLPIFFAAALYPRLVYLAMFALYASVTTLMIVFGSPKDPADTARTFFVFLVAVGIGAETLHRFIGWLEQARAALRASEERFRSLSAMAPLGIFETDPDGRYTYTNPRWQSITGLGAEAGLGEGWADTIFQEDRKAVLDEWHRSNRQGREFSRVFRVSLAGDGIRWVRLQSAVKYLAGDQVAGRVGTLEDITEERAAAEALRLANEALEKRVTERTVRLTQAVEQLETEIAERQRAADALSQSEERFSKAFNTSPSPILISSLVDGRTIDVNDSFLRLTGYAREEVLGLSVVNMELWRKPEDRASLIALVSKHGSVHDFETVIRPQSGKDFTVLISAETITIGDEKCLLVIATDISERKALEESLRSYAETQRQLLQHRVVAQEAERRRLSMDVHDGPLQSLGVSLIALDRAIRRLERGERDLAFGELRFLRSSLAGTVAEVRAVLADLSVDKLTQDGLAAALRGNVDRFSEITGIQVELDDQLEARLPGDLELLLYRLAQEALTNVRKHAEATKVLVRIEAEVDELVMTIRDDGRGFDPEELPASRRAGEQLGLASMKERVQAMRGDLKIISSRGGGTTLIFRCPVPPAERL